jgi:NADH-ubiquinone oxidoreductase chain 5
MEGPTPVSALIHAATMVTAGIFLIIRCSYLFEYLDKVTITMAFIGALTTLFAGITALVQTDIKKIIAFSTCSQLGYMLFGCGLSNYIVTFYHLVNHAFFKALLFLGAGSIIHSFSDEQDVRRMGGLSKFLPLSLTVMLIGTLALSGLPYFSGFYSKDLLIESTFSVYLIKGTFTYSLSTIVAILTGMYSINSLDKAFNAEPNGFKNYYQNVHSNDFAIIIPLVFLSFLSIFSGYLLQEIFIIGSLDFFQNSVFIMSKSFNIFESEFLPFSIKVIPVFLSSIL